MNGSYHVLSQNPSDTRVREYKKRKLHLKEESGCISCKAKRVKCDEHHPICIRCRRTKRVCKYNVKYTTQHNSWANVPSSLRRIRTASIASNPIQHTSLLYQPPQQLSLPFTFQPGPSSGTCPHHLLHHFLHTPCILAIPSKQPILDLTHSHPLISHALLAFTASHLRHNAPSLQHRIAEHYQTSLTLTEYHRYLHTQAYKLGQEGLNALIVAGTLLMMMAFTLPAISTSTQPQSPGGTRHQPPVSPTVAPTSASYSPSPWISHHLSTSGTSSRKDPNWLSLQTGLRPLLLSLSKADSQSRSRSESDSSSSYLQATLNFAATVFMGPELARIWTRRPIGLVNQNSDFRGRMDNAGNIGDADAMRDAAGFVGDDGFRHNDKGNSERAEKTERTEQSKTPIPHLWRRYFRLPEADIDVNCDGHANGQTHRHGGNNTMHRDSTAAAAGATNTHTTIPALDPTILALLPAIKLLAKLRSLPHPRRHLHAHAHPPHHQRESQRQSQSQTQSQSQCYTQHPHQTHYPSQSASQCRAISQSQSQSHYQSDHHDGESTSTCNIASSTNTSTIHTTSTSIFTHLAFLPKLTAVQHLLHPKTNGGLGGSNENEDEDEREGGGEDKHGREKAMWCLGYWWGLMGRFVGVDVGVDVGIVIDGHQHETGSRSRIGTDRDADGLWWCRDRIHREYWGILGWCRDRERECERRGVKVSRRRRRNRGGQGDCHGETDSKVNSEDDGVNDGDAHIWSAMVRELEMVPYIGLSQLN